MQVTFKKISSNDVPVIFSWLNQSHVQEFWDNSQSHKDDIINFTQGRITPSLYCDGLYQYFIGSLNDIPYCLIMIIKEQIEYDIGPLKKAYLSKTGSTYSMDFMIGNPDFLGKGLAAETIKLFIQFIKKELDPCADTFLIDPETRNPRAKHVYEKAGFIFIDEFASNEKMYHLLVKRVASEKSY